MDRCSEKSPARVGLRYVAPLLITIAGCPAMFRSAMVEGIASDMRRQTDETTYQELRSEIEEVEGHPIIAP
jgi:hypothetical protein